MVKVNRFLSLLLSGLLAVALTSYRPAPTMYNGRGKIEKKRVEALHKYYLGLTEVNVNTQKNTLDVSTKLFVDDVELELEKTTGKKIDLSKTKDGTTEKVLADYLTKNFKINVGGVLQKLDFVGYEIENDAVWCYSEVHIFKGTGTVSILNTLLYGNFPEQSNLMNVNWDGTTKTVKLTNPDKLAEFKF